jgi:transposase
VIAQHLEAEPEAMALLDTIPGVSQRTAEILLADIGTDMTRFPSAKHLASWAGMCPGHHERAGKRLSGKTRKGSRWRRQVLVEAAMWRRKRSRPTSPPSTSALPPGGARNARSWPWAIPS